MPPERSASRLRRLVRRSRGVFTLFGEALAEQRRRERADRDDELRAGTTSVAPNPTALEADDRTPTGTIPVPGVAAPDGNSGVHDTHALLHSRFGLLEDRLGIVSARLELLGERVDTALRKAQRPRAAPNNGALETEVHALADRISSLERSGTLPPPAATPFSEGTLRPPKVPQGMEVPIVTAPSVSGFGERATRPPRKQNAGPVLSGEISGLSLGSLFSLFEFERSTGTLCLRNGGHRLDLVLRGGSVVRSELDGARTSAATAVREAFAWPLSTFSFQRELEEDDTEPPQSVNALMLEAMRCRDEELRTG